MIGHRKVLALSLLALAFLTLGISMLGDGPTKALSAAPAWSPFEPAAVSQPGLKYTVVDFDPNPGGVSLNNTNKIVRDSAGRLIVVYTLKTQQAVPWNNYSRTSIDQGASWSAPVRIDSYHLPDSMHSPSLAIDSSDRLHAGFSFNIQQDFTSSFDHGANWIDHSVLRNDGNGAVSVAVDPTNRLHIAYSHQEGLNALTYNLYYISSADGGLNWSAALNLTGHSGDVFVGNQEITTGPGGWLYICYDEIISGVSSRWLIYYDGSAWSAPVRLGAAGVDAARGDLAVDTQGVLHLIYGQKNSVSGRRELIYRQFNPATRSLSAPRTLSGFGESVYNLTLGVYQGDLVQIAYDLTGAILPDGMPIYAGVYTRSSDDDFAERRKISTHSEARSPNLRSSQTFFHQPQYRDIVWIEPDDVAGGEKLVYSELVNGAPVPGDLTVQVLGTRIANPGQDAAYLLSYQNGMTTTAQSVVLQVPLPEQVNFVSATGGGVYLSSSNEVYWKLGDLAPGESGEQAIVVKIPWTGEAFTYNLGARIASPSLANNLIDVDHYLNTIPNQKSTEVLESADVERYLDQSTDLAAMADYALQKGYLLNYSGQREVITTTQQVKQIIRLGLLRLDLEGDLEMAFLVDDDGSVYIESYNDTQVMVFDDQGGYVIDRSSGLASSWGTWAPGVGTQRLALASAHSPQSTASFANCVRRCSSANIGDVVLGEFSNLYDLLQAMKSCVSCAKGQKFSSKECIECAIGVLKGAGKEIPGGSVLVTMGDCVANCYQDENYMACNPGAVNQTEIPLYDLWNAPKKGHCWYEYDCDPDGNWIYRSVRCCDDPNAYVTFTVVNGVSQASCLMVCPMPSPAMAPDQEAGVTRLAPLSETNPCDEDETEVVPAHDPNAKSVSAPGNVLPGEWITYTIEYENTGAGTAYGVFIEDTLDSNLDGSTVNLLGQSGAEYDPDSRLIIWDVGTLAAGEGGQVQFRVRVKTTAPQNTQIVNQAIVHFPSAREQTPTNPVVSIVKNPAAEPQNLQAVAGTPISIRLKGRDSQNRTLKFKITANPLYGEISGTPPSLVYSPAEGFFGQDEFWFSVHNGVNESDPARVAIIVSPDPNDQTAPQVVKVYPADGAQNVPANAGSSSSPVRTPYIAAVFSEAMRQADFSETTFSLLLGDGVTSGFLVTGGVEYDWRKRTATFRPDQELIGGALYSAMLSGLHDAAGNLLPDYIWRFWTAAGPVIQVTLPLSETKLDFTWQPGSAFSEAAVAVGNVGVQDLSIIDLELSGNSAAFSLTNGCTSPLAVGEQCSILVKPVTGLLGKVQAVLRIHSNDPSQPWVEVPLQAQRPAVFLPMMMLR